MTVERVDEFKNAYAIRILAYLYALAAAELNGDFEAAELLRDALEPADEEHLPEAAVAVAAAIAARTRDWDPRSEARFRGLSEGVLNAVSELLDGGRPREVHLEHGDDPVEVAVNTVTAFWLWGTEDDYPEARRLAQQHCLQLAGFGPF